ncbi:LOW QUALITY PROTEIN: uncharacterized protein EMH_0040920 [Eimeria mitis]|uniref:Ribosome biogenesis protein BMS1/TSR1 C-terminal domain-containing protein n=1 Tax=Eimeria mitis TaxID=44415 RepID=U6JSR0_9EIME|nr:LOW QUALITY PROTEIN: uncharacterized protein EMH_0040920 [Eimeria mitis]CDJ28449.1 hypothetical protein, conserved [Eimeria mitis]
MGHRHRSLLKQQNKAFKGSASKPKNLKEKRRAAAANAAALSINRPITKSDRVQRSKQRRLQLRRDHHQQQASSPSGPPPKVVVLLPFSDCVCIDRVFDALRRELVNEYGAAANDDVSGGGMDEDETTATTNGAMERAFRSHPHHCPYLFTLPAYARNPEIPKRHPQQVLLVPAPRIDGGEAGDVMQQEGGQPERPSELLRYMDLCSCCDVLLCVFGGNCTYENSAFSSRGYKVLQALKLQGLPPSVIGIGCVDPSLLDPAGAQQGKHTANESLKFMRRFFESELGSERLPVHITGVGDFVLARIDPMVPVPKRREFAAVGSHATTDIEVLEADLQEVVQASHPLQPLDIAALEQTWPTEDEMAGDDGTASAAPRRCVRVPKDVGDYERAWLESDTDGTDDDREEEVNMNSDADMQPEEATYADTEPASTAPDEADDDWKPLNGAEQQQMKTDKYVLARVGWHEAYAAQRREAAEMEKEFPDQVDTPLDIPAKERFQKYRGLKSFRSSPWAQNEDLPIGYGRIIDGLATFAHRAHAEMCKPTGGFSGRFCRLLIPLRHSYMLQQLVKQHSSLSGRELEEALAEAMAQRVASRFTVEAQILASAPKASADNDLMVPDFLLVSQLLQHESQVAVVHSQVTFCDDSPIKGKDPLLMACGFRRFPAAPIYSEEPRHGMHSAAKWKLKRWAEPALDKVRVTAWGSILPVNKASSRLIIKRVLLSGHPFKVHRRKAVVRFMFFNPDDVRWFAPIELHTKRGLRGNIVEPLGTHGYMKCKFSDYLKQNDEVNPSLVTKANAATKLFVE